MTSTREFQPDWISAPGDTIKDVLDERNLSVQEFAEHIQRPLSQVNELLEGRATITLGLARQLVQVLGASVEFWMARDFQFREDAARLNRENQTWLRELPLGDMIRFGWLTPTPHPSDELEACLRFFNVISVREWHRAYADVEKAVTFRTSRSFESRPAAVAAWLRQGEIEADSIESRPWDANRFREVLPRLRLLTRKRNPSEFIPQLQELCADSGVAVAVVRCPVGCRASGATRFLTKDKALVLLSFRYLTDDQFWFTFFHEAGHLLLHRERSVFLEGLEGPSDRAEEEANRFAGNLLVPPEFQTELQRLPASDREVIRFAKRLAISPGIVVGQLQHLGRIGYDQMNHLKRRFKWVE